MRHSPDNNKLAVVVDMRSRSFFNEIRTILDELDNQEDLDFKVLFLDATDSELVARYKETRRSHPLAGRWPCLRWNYPRARTLIPFKKYQSKCSGYD